MAVGGRTTPIAGSRFALPRHRERPQQASVFPLCVDESREQAFHRQTIDVAGVNAREQGLGEKFGGFAPEAATHERANRLIGVILARRHEQLHAHPQLP